MSAQEIFYAKVQPQDFVLVDSSGDRVVNHTWASGDANLHIDGAAAVNVYTAITHIADGLYTWTPADTSNTTGKRITLLLKDTVGGAFIQNALKFVTGGHRDAYFNAIGD